MGEIVSIQSKQNLPTATATPGEKELTPNLGKSPRVPPTLADATAAFTFSRLPREQRIAQTIVNALLGNATLERDVKISFPWFKDANDPFIVDLATKLEPYARKDFAVRYGHLEDGNAKA
jgi:hypothetical protein